MKCEKCHGDMKKRSRVNKKGTGLEKTYWLCRCGWAIDDKSKEGYWVA